VTIYQIVATGLDPVAHAESTQIRARRMDCRVEPGNDDKKNVAEIGQHL